MPSRLHLRLVCWWRGVNLKNPQNLTESIVTDYLNNPWITLPVLATCYGFTEEKLLLKVKEFLE